jgi:hypothetical protein
LTPAGLILMAKRIVPSFKWAIAGAALLVLAGSVVKWGFNSVTVLLVAGVIVVLSVAFLVLLWLSKLKPEKTSGIAVFFAWSLMLMLIGALGCVLSSAVTNTPWPVKDWIRRQIESGSTNLLSAQTNKTTPGAIPSSTLTRIETLEVRWVFPNLAGDILDRAVDLEVEEGDYWFRDDNLNIAVGSFRASLTSLKNRQSAYHMLQIAAGHVTNRLTHSIIALLEMNEPGSLTLPFGEVQLRKEGNALPGYEMKFAGFTDASSGIEMLYPEIDNPLPAVEAVEPYQAVTSKRTRKRAPLLSFERRGATAQIELNADASALSDWLDRLPTAGDFMNPLPNRLRIVLLSNIESLPVSPARLCAVVPALDRETDRNINTMSQGNGNTELRNSYLAIKPNQSGEVYYKVIRESDATYERRLVAGEPPLPVCQATIFKAQMVTTAEFEEATTTRTTAINATNGTGAVVIFASDDVLWEYRLEIKELIGGTPLIELPLRISVDEAVAWCLKAKPAAIIASSKIFGPTWSPEYRAVLLDVVKHSGARVMRLRPKDGVASISDFEEEQFQNLVDAKISGKTTEEVWELIREFLSQSLSN